MIRRKEQPPEGSSINREEDSNHGSSLRKQAMYVLKEMDVQTMEPEILSDFQNEIQVLQRLDHPNIIRAKETYHYISDDGRRMIGIVLELCEGGDLLSRASYSERQVGAILYKLIEAVNYMHKHNFIHRDIKLENIMFESNEPDSDIRLADFGLCTKFVKNECFDEVVGTMYTIAPQVLMGNYTQASDMWSVGVVAFTLLSGEKPFRANRSSDVRRAIIVGNYNFDSPAWEGISEGAKKFVTKLLEYFPSARYTAEQALSDEWLAQFKPAVSPSVVRDVLSRLKRVSQMSEFEKLAWLVAARNADPHEIAQWRSVFDELDQNHDGQISYDEFRTAMTKIFGCQPNEVAEIFRQVDVQNTGFVEYTTFLAALLAGKERLQEDHLAEVFAHFDVDNCGYVTREHLRRLLGKKVSNNYISKLIQEVESCIDGKIQYKDLKQSLSKMKRSYGARSLLSA